MVSRLYRLLRGLAGGLGLRQGLARAINDHAGLRRLALGVYAATLVRQSLRFLAREWARSAGPHVYTLVRGGEVVLRHGSSDAEILAEIFGWQLYAPPPEVLSVLPAGRPLAVLDLGAHVGMFGLLARQRFPRCVIESFEPDPDNRLLLEISVRANRAEGTWRVVPACAGAADGELPFAGGRGAASAVDDRASLRVAALDVLPRLAAVDLLKMDIEGGEWPILGDPRFASSSFAAAVIEVHPRGAPGPDYRAEAERLLRAAGLEVCVIHGAPQGAEMYWAWRPQR